MTTFSRIYKKTFSFTTRSSFLEKVRQGNEKAWFEFHQKYRGMIYHIGSKRGLSEAECEDLMNEVMVIFWKKMESFIYDRERGKFSSYLGRIADFAALRMFKKKQKYELTTTPIPENYPADIDAKHMEEWKNFLFEKALEELKETVDTEIWQAFYMSTIQNRSVEEVSAITRKSANNIYVIRSRCLKKLKAIISVYREFAENELPGNSPKNAEPY